jgi:hypothetical protein
MKREKKRMCFFAFGSKMVRVTVSRYIKNILHHETHSLQLFLHKKIAYKILQMFLHIV